MTTQAWAPYEGKKTDTNFKAGSGAAKTIARKVATAYAANAMDQAVISVINGMEAASGGMGFGDVSLVAEFISSAGGVQPQSVFGAAHQFVQQGYLKDFQKVAPKDLAHAVSTGAVVVGSQAGVYTLIGHDTKEGTYQVIETESGALVDMDDDAANDLVSGEGAEVYVLVLP